MAHEPIKIGGYEIPAATLDRGDWIRAGVGALFAAMVFAIFHFFGNTNETGTYARSVFNFMITRWNDGNGQNAHGYLIPLISLYVIWRRRAALLAAPKSISWWGMVIFATGLLLHWAGARVQQPRLSIVGLIVLLWGTPFFLYGWEVAKLLIFPSAFLIFCIPLEFIEAMTAPLQVMAATISAFICRGFGLNVYQKGSGLALVDRLGRIDSNAAFDVAPSCSGLSSVLAMTALVAVYANLTQERQRDKWLLFLWSIPIAIVGNIARVTIIVVVARLVGREKAMWFHDHVAGYMVFVVGITMMLWVGAWMRRHKDTPKKTGPPWS